MSECHPHRGTGCNGSKIGFVPSDRDANPVEQDHSGSELDTGEEISGKFVVARGDGAKGHQSWTQARMMTSRSPLLGGGGARSNVRTTLESDCHTPETRIIGAPAAIARAKAPPLSFDNACARPVTPCGRVGWVREPVKKFSAPPCYLQAPAGAQAILPSFSATARGTL